MIIGSAHAGSTDRAKQLVHLAIAAGRRFQSSQTKFVHYYHRPIDYSMADTIPLYENFLFVLALLRERTSESFAEGKALLDRLLYFQNFLENPQLGNFPVYLHQYPDCTDRYLGFQLLPVFYWTLRQFSIILGAELRERLVVAARTLLSYCVKTQTDTPAPPHLAIKVAAAMEAFGRLWADPALQQSGLSALEDLRLRVDQEDSISSLIPTMTADILLALQMVYESFGSSPWANFWRRVCALWHVGLASYVGPAWQVFQVRSEAQATLYDLYMGYFSESYSHRALETQAFQLEGILIQPSADTIQQPALPFEKSGIVSGRHWMMRQTPQYGLALLQKCERDPAKDPSYSPLRLVWGDLNRAHSLALQGGSSESVNFEVTPSGVTLLLQLPTEIPNEVKQRNREALLFIDSQEAMRFEVGGKSGKATTFQLGEVVRVHARGMELIVSFTLDLGEGRFFGHLSPGNRPAQLNHEGADRFAVFDRSLFLRTISRSPDCRVRISLQF